MEEMKEEGAWKCSQAKDNETDLEELEVKDFDILKNTDVVMFMPNFTEIYDKEELTKIFNAFSKIGPLEGQDVIFPLKKEQEVDCLIFCR